MALFMVLAKMLLAKILRLHAGPIHLRLQRFDATWKWLQCQRDGRFGTADATASRCTNGRVVFLPPLSIVHIDTAHDWRGGQESLLTLARGLRARGHSQTIV